MKQERLRLGAAYHGNRMPAHARADLLDMATHGLDLVVHMFSHNDWERLNRGMKEIVTISEDLGLEVWMDNWGLGGPPGDKSHFLGAYPDSHMYYSNGDLVPYCVCLNSPDFRRFTREWIDAVHALGVKTLFWDEPHMPVKKVNGQQIYGCACPRCRKLFEEKYGRPMPVEPDADAKNFGTDTIVDYLAEMTEYSAARGMINTVCVMLGTYGMSLEVVDRICALPHLHNVGSDPYWLGAKAKNPDLSVYEFVYNGTKENLRVANQFGKDHNIWIQAYGNPRGREEEVVEAAEAAYDAGARTIIAWSYGAGSSNDYAAENPPVTWSRMLDGFARVRNMERDRILSENRRLYRK